MTTDAKKASWTLDPVHSSVGATINHMVVGRAKVKFSKFEVDLSYYGDKPEDASFQARLDPASVDTGDAKRDAHLHSPDFFDVTHFPWITSRSQSIEPVAGDRYRIIGDLTIRDVTKPMEITATFGGIVRAPYGNQRMGVSAEMAIKRSDYGLNWNVPLEGGGAMLGDKVKVDIEAEFVKQEA